MNKLKGVLRNKKIVFCFFCFLVLLSISLLFVYYDFRNPIKQFIKEYESKNAVLEVLKDSESAKFKNRNGYCGEVNAKNGFGSYTGYERYVYNKRIGYVFFENQFKTDIYDSKYLDKLLFELDYETCSLPDKVNDRTYSKLECIDFAFLSYNYLILFNADRQQYQTRLNAILKAKTDTERKLLINALANLHKTLGGETDIGDLMKTQLPISLFATCYMGDNPYLTKDYAAKHISKLK